MTESTITRSAACRTARSAPGAAPALDIENRGDDQEGQLGDLIEDAAAASGLPVDYFTRLIWRESSFRTWVVSPVGAQGIAQFMPGTAAMRGLDDSFDIDKALRPERLMRPEEFSNLVDFIAVLQTPTSAWLPSHS